MDKRNRWQTILVALALVLTLYNILPTVIYYMRPLDKPIEKEAAADISRSVLHRINSLEQENLEWIRSFCRLLHLKPVQIQLDESNFQNIKVRFESEKEADFFAKYLPKAGSLIDFYPASLSLAKGSGATMDPKEVSVFRKIPLHFENSNNASYLSYSSMWESQNTPSEGFKEVVSDRLFQIGATASGSTPIASLATTIVNDASLSKADELLLLLSGYIKDYLAIGQNQPALRARLFSGLTQADITNRNAFLDSLEKITSAAYEKSRLARESLAKQPEDSLEKEQGIARLSKQEDDLSEMLSTFKKYRQEFVSGATPLSQDALESLISSAPNSNGITSFAIGQYNPVIAAIGVDWVKKQIYLELHPEFAKALSSNEDRAENGALLQLLFSEISRISRQSSERFERSESLFTSELTELKRSGSFLSFKLQEIAASELSTILKTLESNWLPTSADFNTSDYPVVTMESYSHLSPIAKRFALIGYAPLLEKGLPKEGFRTSSIYIIAKGVQKIFEKASQGSKENLEIFKKDLDSLRAILENHGASAYPGTTYPLPAEYKDDLIFEIPDYYKSILQASREHFTIKGSHRFAILELSDLRQRIGVENQIDNIEQQELLKWRDEYRAASVNPDKQPQYQIPKPTRNPLLSNMWINIKKFFRGDDRKVLKWGLDLSGGKSVLIALKDRERLITDPSDIAQGISELTKRVNGMGVSEVSIRKEGNFIALDFPGSTTVSAHDLVQSASMTFNIVNEKFSPRNAELQAATNQFLQEIWDESLVTGQKEALAIERIAWNHLYGFPYDSQNVRPQSESAKVLYNAGLRLATSDQSSNGNFDDSLSRVVIMRGDNYSEWAGQTHPLMIVFHNFAMKGSFLENIRALYDQRHGNTLSFEVKSSFALPGGEILSPREILYSWTSQFAKDKIASSSYGQATNNRGWRMAVILNEEVISSPELESALRDSGMINGHFTQQEIYRLKADLQAGSLTYTPEIISETIISPELGFKERVKGVVATIVALIAVVIVMLYFYRFAGLIASVAVIFDLFLIWATLQNLGASVSLPGLAGVILTLGIALDANVLVFERIKEELASGARVGASIARGYKKAFSAIIDSNVTSLIAALILFQFDAGPVKAFALTLITGIVASLFTGLFVTRYIFSRWLETGEKTELPMANVIPKTSFAFMKRAPLFLWASAVVVIAASVALVFTRNSLLGLDFTGGHILTVHLENSPSREAVEHALTKAGAGNGEFQVRELAQSGQFKLYFSTRMENQGSPWAHLEKPMNPEALSYTYEQHPEIVWIVSALKDSGLVIETSTLARLSDDWNSVSGQLSDIMKQQAILGLMAAFAAIFVYIALRFAVKHAICAIIGLVFDLVVTLALVVLLHTAGVPITVDLNTIAALLTILGFSLNDTIIVFDRIRDEILLHRRSAFREVIDLALNVTLSRTMMTSGITFLVLFILVLLGGMTLFNFSIVMLLGVVVGTLSSLFVASFSLYFLEKRDSDRYHLVTSAK